MSWSWEWIYYENMWIQIGIAVGILLLFLLFRKIFSKYIYTLIIKLSKKAPSDLLSNIFLAFERPIQWLFVIIGIYVAAKYFPFVNPEHSLFIHLVRSSVIFLIMWGLFNLSSSSSLLFKRINEKSNIQIDAILIPFLSKAIRVIIVAIGISVILQEFNYDINGFIAGLGLGGLAFALAAQDAIKNLFGGVIIITEKPFSIGDWIMTPSVEGTVEDITFRSTMVRTFQQALVTVPNSTLANETITNWSKMGKRQITFNLRVTHDTPKDKLENVVQQINALLKNHPEVHPETIFATFDQYQDNGLGIFIYFFTKTTVWAEYLKVREEINFEILEILDNEEVSIGLPSRRVYMENGSDYQVNPTKSVN